MIAVTAMSLIVITSPVIAKPTPAIWRSQISGTQTTTKLHAL